MLFARFHQIAKRIARRFGPETVVAFMDAVERFQSTLDRSAVQKALVAGDLASLDAALAGSRFAQLLRGIEDPFRRTAGATGTASAGLLDEAGFAVRFNAAHPNIVQWARDQSAMLIRQVTEEVKEAVRVVVALGNQQGLTVVDQARAIEQVVGLPPHWARAPVTFAQELRDGDVGAATRRRLSATDKAQIRSKIRKGTVDGPFVREMQEKYTKSLTRRRALTIARTENLRAANFGQFDSWGQAVQQGAIPATARRVWIVTPDSRLSEEHSTIPFLNAGGRGMTEPFITTEGLFMFPPSRPNCRCGVGLRIE